MKRETWMAGKEKLCKPQRLAYILFAPLALSAISVFGYEIETHYELSEKSAGCSILAKDAFMEGLGLFPLDAPDTVIDIPDPEIRRPYTLKKLIAWGAKVEDSASLFPPSIRPLNHFFDPLRNEPLNVAGIHFKTLPDWALEDGNPQPDIEHQDNSLFDIYDYLRNALGKPETPGGSSTKVYRESYWGKVFQSLGMVIHHIQDMSQPQHVRQNMHCNSVACIPFFYNPSWYEKYTNADGNRQKIIANYDCNSYQSLDLNKFTKARNFWATETGEGIGLAEFTNRNFVSSNTNFRQALFGGEILADGNYENPDPRNGGTGLIEEKIDICDPTLLGPGFQLCGEMRFLGTWVDDNYLQSSPPKLNKRTSSYSLWTNKLDEYNVNAFTEDVERIFNLNRFNFEAAYEFLIPRAIAYSAGLIDYFFRGRMQVSEVSYIGGDKVSLTVTNTTAEENPGGAPFTFTGLTPSQPGRFYLYQDEADGTRWELPPINTQDAELTYLEVFDASDALALEFSLSAVPGSPDFALDKPLTLVYDGLIGEERGIAVASFSLSRLLAFDISRTAAGAPVPNIVDIYQSQDSGASWQPVAGVEIALSDTIPDIGDRLAVQAVTYIGNGAVLVYPDYLDFGGSGPSMSIAGFRLEQFGQSLGSALPLDFSTLLTGTENFADGGAALRSLTHTGGRSLAALQIRHPDSGAAPPRTRTFQLLQVSDWEQSTAWTNRGGWGEGGLPELSWRGGDRYAMAAYVECIEWVNPCSPQNNKFGSALRATDDAGATYRDLASFTAECTQYDFFCIQFIRPLDDGRLLGWVTRRGTVDPGPVTLYVSSDDGASWSIYGAAPVPDECVGIDYPYVVVEDIVYLGSRYTVGQQARDSLFIQATCNRINTDSNGQIFYGFEEISCGAFATTDSGTTWTKVINPPHQNGRVIFAGDNGVVPGLYGP